MHPAFVSDASRRARLWLGVAVLALASAAAIAWFCERALALPSLVGGFERTVAAADLPVVVLPPVTVVARRGDLEPRAQAPAAAAPDAPPRG